jgi:molecular chaperone DnaK (HSP70)
VAFSHGAAGAASPVLDLSIPQVQRPGQVAAQPLLPSFLYLPGEHELPSGAAALPWDSAPKTIAGEFARWQGARVPGRLVASAKSWLCHDGVDRTAPILPWGAPQEVARVSPTEASALLLAHMAAAWNAAHPGLPLADQEVVITVPASFDEVARSLTVAAAQRAGLRKFTLVEEPLAAFYDFLSRNRNDIAGTLSGIRLVLVVDVGGGTTDFTLVSATLSVDGPALRRVAVGDHLMLGGDNMDAALARLAEARLVAGGRKLSTAQWIQLVQATRSAKEVLFTANAPERHGISLLGEGTRLLGGTLSTELGRDEAAALLLDGFFPTCSPDERPRRSARTGLQEIGLPYAQDPAITRHLAGFLAQHSAAGYTALGSAPGDALPRPDAILLNGGVFKSQLLVQRLLDIVSSWWPDSPRIPLLGHDSLELAVARGAAYYGLARRGLGQRIGGGAAHALYVGLAEAKAGGQPRALCVVPRGQEEGVPVELSDRVFSLTLGKPVQFPLYSTTADRVDRPGDVVAVNEELTALPLLHTVLQSSRQRTETTVPVYLRANLTEIGTLELSCVSADSDERWRLEFGLRGTAGPSGPSTTAAMPAELAQVREIIERVYGSKPQTLEDKEVQQLGRNLEDSLGPRDTWSLPVLREMWGILHASASRRRRSARHERVFLQLFGYTLRPGFGYPLDEWRCAQTFRLLGETLGFPAEASVWNEYWVLCRRAAGGLDQTQQMSLWHYLKPHLARRVPPSPPKNLPRPKGPQPEGFDEMVRAAASLERIEPAEKVIFGNWIAARLRSPGRHPSTWAWALGRLGARVPLHGSIHRAVRAEDAAAWLELLLDLGLTKLEGAPFAAAQLARCCGDRLRDIDDALRQRTATELRRANASEHWIQMVEQVVVLEADDEARALGDSLPLGLKLRDHTNEKK